MEWFDGEKTGKVRRGDEQNGDGGKRKWGIRGIGANGQSRYGCMGHRG